MTEKIFDTTEIFQIFSSSIHSLRMTSEMKRFNKVNRYSYMSIILIRGIIDQIGVIFNLYFGTVTSIKMDILMNNGGDSPVALVIITLALIHQTRLLVRL